MKEFVVKYETTFLRLALASGIVVGGVELYYFYAGLFSSRRAENEDNEELSWSEKMIILISPKNALNAAMLTMAGFCSGVVAFGTIPLLTAASFFVTGRHVIGRMGLTVQSPFSFGKK